MPVRQVEAGFSDDVDATAAAERQFRRLADNAPVMVWRANSSRRCDFFNAAWVQFTGRGLEAELGLGWTRGLHPDDYRKTVDTFLAATAGRIPFTLDYHLRRHDGEYRWMLSNGVPYYQAGRFAGFLGSCVDISEAGERRSEDRQIPKALRELNHRVKNSLQTSLCFSALGLPMAQAATQTELTRLTERLSLLALVHEEVSRCGEGRAVDLCEYLGSLAGAVQAAMGNPNVELTVACEPAVLSRTRATTIGTIIDELLTRALSQGFAHDRPGAIRLESRPLPDQRIEVSISEQGAAEPPDEEPGRASYQRQLLERLTAHAQGTIRYELAPEKRSVITLEPD